METWTGAGLLLHFLWTDFASSLRSNSENVLNVQCRSKSPSATKDSIRQNARFAKVDTANREDPSLNPLIYPVHGNI